MSPPSQLVANVSTATLRVAVFATDNYCLSVSFIARSPDAFA